MQTLAMHISDVLDILDIHRGTHLPCGVKRGQSALAHLHVIAKGGKRGNIVQKQMGGEKDAHCYHSKSSRSYTCVLNTLVMRGEAEGSINLRPPPFEGWRGQKKRF